MGPSRRVLWIALSLAVPGSALSAAAASAQFFAPAVQALELSTAPLSRSPRLVGMGGLTLVVPDRDNALDLWDFAGIPVGAISHDSTSTLDMRPGSQAASGEHDLGGGLTRQDLGARTMLFQVESFHRPSDGGSTFGLVGEVDNLTSNTPFSRSTEERESVRLPYVQPILGGPVPFMLGGRLQYALHLRIAAEHLHDQYRQIISNAAGEWLDQNGTEVTPPNFFDPVDYTVKTAELGASLAYPFGRRTRFALGFAGVRNQIRGTNNGDRYSSGRDENRPFAVGQSALVGSLGSHLDYGVSGRAWSGTSEQEWRFSTSGGAGGLPFTGRGKLLDRKEQGSTLDARARWHAGRLELGGSLSTRASKVIVDPPAAGDLTSLNYFINNVVLAQKGADTLALPDSVVHDDARHYAVAYAGGLSWSFGRGIAGAEYHWTRDLAQALVAGLGPRYLSWDVRGGLEWRLSPVLRGRLGYRRERVDLDTYTQGNEYVGDTGTLGIGLTPAGATWSTEIGYAYEWRRTDFPDPLAGRQGRQYLAAQLHWVF